MVESNFKVEGFKELDAQLSKLSRKAGKAVLRRSLKKAAQPIVDAAQASAPRDTGEFAQTISASPKLNKAQKRVHKKEETASSVELFVGSSSPLAHLLEFGTRKAPPHPFMRAAFEASVEKVIEILKVELWKEIQKSINRANKAASRKR